MVLATYEATQVSRIITTNLACTVVEPHKINNSFSVLVDIDLLSVPPVILPLGSNSDRISVNEATGIFEPQSPEIFKVAYYAANDPTTPHLISVYLCAT